VIALIALCGMAQLLVRNVPDEVVRSLKLRAAALGISAEEEHRRILAKAMVEADKKANESRIRDLLNLPGAGDTDDSDDWRFDRSDARNARVERRDQGLND
jgi:antitoxin FitA